jgi:Putative zinc-finger
MNTQLPSTGCPYELWDGAYVLGSLSPAERREFEAHLDGCSTCSRAVRDLAGLPGLLGRIGPDVFEDAEQSEPVPETLMPRLSRAVRREQRRRTWVASGIAAAAAVAITVGGVVVFDRPSHTTDAGQSSVATPPSRPMTSVSDDPMTASLAMTPVAWGTRMVVTCHYPRPSGTTGGLMRGRYMLVVHTTDGRREQAASWRSIPGQVMELPGSTSASLSQISRVDVTWPDGTPVLELSF